MKTFTVNYDQVSVGIPVYKAENNDYYIRLSNSSYPPEKVRRYLKRNPPPEIKNNFIYDLDLFHHRDSGRTFLCHPRIEDNSHVLILLKHNCTEMLKDKFVVYRDTDLPYMMIRMPINSEFLFFIGNESDKCSFYKVTLDKNLNLNSVEI